MLLNYLPREAAYVQAVAGESAAWGDAEHLLAGLIDVVQYGNYLATRAHFKGNHQLPKPVRRPGDKPGGGDRLGGGRRYTQTEMRAILDSWGDTDVTETETREVT